MLRAGTTFSFGVNTNMGGLHAVMTATTACRVNSYTRTYIFFLSIITLACFMYFYYEN